MISYRPNPLPAGIPLQDDHSWISEIDCLYVRDFTELLWVHTFSPELGDTELDPDIPTLPIAERYDTYDAWKAQCLPGAEMRMEQAARESLDDHELVIFRHPISRSVIGMTIIYRNVTLLPDVDAGWILQEDIASRDSETPADLLGSGFLDMPARDQGPSGPPRKTERRAAMITFCADIFVDPKHANLRFGAGLWLGFIYAATAIEAAFTKSVQTGSVSGNLVINGNQPKLPVATLNLDDLTLGLEDALYGALQIEAMDGDPIIYPGGVAWCPFMPPMVFRVDNPKDNGDLRKIFSEGL